MELPIWVGLTVKLSGRSSLSPSTIEMPQLLAEAGVRCEWADDGSWRGILTDSTIRLGGWVWKRAFLVLFLKCGSDRLAWPALGPIGYSNVHVIGQGRHHPSSMICSLQDELRVEEARVSISLTSPTQVDGKGRLTVDLAREDGQENDVSAGDG